MGKYLQTAVIVCLLALGIIAGIAVHNNRGLRAERDRYKGNTEALLTDVETYRVRDSLSAARAESLELTVKEYQRFRAEDAALIKELQGRNRDLAGVNKAQAQTIIELRSIPKDTVIVRDSVELPAIKLHCGDAWFDFDGLLAGGEFTGRLQNRDSIIIAETIQYKRFLGFLWKTKCVKDKKVDCVSKNPHTKIIGVEHITIIN